MKSFLTIAVVTTCIAIAPVADAKTKNTYNRADFSEAKKAEIYKRALASCRKAHGDKLHNVEVNYTYNRVICWSY